MKNCTCKICSIPNWIMLSRVGQNIWETPVSVSCAKIRGPRTRPRRTAHDPELAKRWAGIAVSA